MVVENKDQKDFDLEHEDNQNEETEEVVDETEEVSSDDVEDKEAEDEESDEKRYAELEDRYIRLQADYSNFRRRSTEEKSRMHALGMETLALDILPVLDNFERALSTDDIKDEKFYEGMEMIADQFREELKKNGIVEIDALDQPFDPNLHHAVMLEEKEDVEPDVVIEVLQKGYKLNDRVIRPSMVKVSR
ncbi:MAG: nucleotide exchange factor GrpE [Peptoniphilus sp.]|nr:nucleotide exchange factor GrpE [Peptoniphilus sp.]MDD7362756.1 nucleotide exchange factor GrpE [Bacillota bacterium]MDY6044550.1 nucleotide exchange factor GrpE [Peptoniphilus sp.]